MLSFTPPSARAASGDLTIQVSPLGLVELADEEFEVHGPRLSRYSLYWAHYLGHMMAYRREIGEPQFSFNYVRAFSDYITNFVFGKGVQFRTPHANAAILMPYLKRVWEQDNDKDSVLMEIGVNGSVTGDMFVKVAYEEMYQDPSGMLHPGRIRILPLNPANCFPEWHPHDKDRMISFKLKYRFWSTAGDGTRQVYTYVERVTDVAIEEYVNDELISSRPNPLGQIPIAYAPNIAVPGSPWGLPDIDAIIPLNRELNEKAMEISDIINYHSAPLTVISGAKLSQIEKGAKKVFTLPKDATIQNLQALVEFQGPMGFLEFIKRGMHEATGVPETALGQAQPISNTSGVALSIQFQPLMNRYTRKTTTLNKLFRKINELIIRTMIQKEPGALRWDPTESAMPEDDQLIELDPLDKNIFETSVHWPPPLPVDILVKLNELQMKMGLGLESKAGALRELGELLPREKLDEIMAEKMEDAKDAGALSLVEAAIAAAVQLYTGVNPNAAEQGMVGPNGEQGVTSPSDGAAAPPPIQVTPEVQQAMSQIVERAYGQKMAGMANPSNDRT